MANNPKQRGDERKIVDYQAGKGTRGGRQPVLYGIGDILWQTAGLAKVMGVTLEEVAEENLEKLASRKQRNVIAGDGDER